MSMLLLSAPPPLVGHESGALFDERVVVVTADEHDDDERLLGAAGWATATSINGSEVRVSVCLASPPATSYVFVQTGDKLCRPLPQVVAAHGALLLLYMSVAVAADDQDEAGDPSGPDCACGSWFVYRADPARPWLRRLPDDCCAAAWLVPTGIVSLPDDEFTVAAFQLAYAFTRDPEKRGLPDQEVAHLSRYSSAADEWELKPLAVPYDGGGALKPFAWRTEKTFSSADGSVYWLDYQLGLLTCNVLDDAPVLRFVPPPEIKMWTYAADRFHAREEFDAYRTAGARGDGTVVLVHVDNGFFGSTKRSGFSVTTWALNKSPEFEWEKTSVLRVDSELWSLPNFRDSPLPRWAPEYPMVSTQQDILHFVLQGYNCPYQDWLITVDMRRKLLQAYEYRDDRHMYVRKLVLTDTTYPFIVSDDALSHPYFRGHNKQ